MFRSPQFPALIFRVILTKLIGSSECVAHSLGGIWPDQYVGKPLLSVSIGLSSWQGQIPQRRLLVSCLVVKSCLPAFLELN